MTEQFTTQNTEQVTERSTEQNSEQNTTSFQVSLLNVNKVNGSYTFQPTSLAKVHHSQKEYITVTITDGRDDLFLEATATQHKPSVFLHSNGTMTVHFDLICYCEVTAKVGSNGIPYKSSEFAPIFREDDRLFAEAKLIRLTYPSDKQRFGLSFDCSYTSEFTHPDDASCR